MVVVLVAIAVLVVARDSGRDPGRRSWSSSSLLLFLHAVTVAIADLVVVLVVVMVRVAIAVLVVARDSGRDPERRSCSSSSFWLFLWLRYRDPGRRS